jgi:hypothetical protein
MRRRAFITLLGGAAAAWPLVARAQQPERVRRIGVLMGYPENDLEGPAFLAAFREALQKLGWAEDSRASRATRSAGSRPIFGCSSTMSRKTSACRRNSAATIGGCVEMVETTVTRTPRRCTASTSEFSVFQRDTATGVKNGLHNPGL